MWDYWILIGVLAIITYLSRLAGIEFFTDRKVPPILQLYFNFVPAGILSAIVVSQLLDFRDGVPSISVPILVGGIVTAISIKLTKSFLISVIVGILVGIFIRFLSN